METIGIVIAGLGIVVALAGSFWTIASMCRKDWWSAALPLGLIAIFPVAVALGWDWNRNVRAGLGMVSITFVLAAILTPLMMSRIGWHFGMERKPYMLTLGGVAVALIGAIIVDLA